jgi:hypothetical protein
MGLTRKGGGVKCVFTCSCANRDALLGNSEMAEKLKPGKARQATKMAKQSSRPARGAREPRPACGVGEDRV